MEERESYPSPDFVTSLGGTGETGSGSSFFGGDDNPASTGVVGPGVGGPEDDSSLSSCGRPLSVARSSSSSNTGSVVCGTSSGRANELLETLEGLFMECESEIEKSHESIVLWNVDDARLSRSWRCVRGGSDSDKVY